jgi:hypothetical protein
LAPNVKNIRRNNKNDNIIQQTNINMLNRFVSDSFRCGIDILIGDRISVVGGTSKLGSNIGSDGEDDVESVAVGSKGVDEDTSVVVSDFF